MNKLRKFGLQMSGGVVAQFFLGGFAFAMCCGFFPINVRSVMPADNTKTLVVYENGIQHLIVQPEFNGQAEDFGLVMPAPSQPDVSEAPADLFTRLEDFTNPLRDWGFNEGIALSDASAESSSREPAVRVLDRKNVGSYTATILSATDATELREWLDNNGYESDETRDDIIAYYVETNGYFVALKVNMAALEGRSTTKLDPIDISYETPAPLIPTRLLAANPMVLSYVVYVLAPEPYVVPGGDVQFAQQLGFSDVTDANGRVLLDYNPYGQWLVRNFFEIDPDLAEEDLYLTRVSDLGSSVVNIDNPRLNVNPRQHIAETGVVRGLATNCWVDTTYDDTETSFEDGFFREPVQPDRFTPRTYDPTECRDSYTFDLAYGDIKTGGGFPLKLVAQTVFWSIVVLFVAWRLWRGKKYGAKAILPRPIKATAKGIYWVDHRTGHHIFDGSKLKGTSLALRNISIPAVLYVFWVLLYALVKALETSSFASVNDDPLVLWTFIGWLGFTVVWLIYVLFIRSTIIAIKDGRKVLFEYIRGLLIGGLAWIIVLWLFSSLLDSWGWI